MKKFTAIVACLVLLESCEKNGDGKGACGAGFDDAIGIYTGIHAQNVTTYSGTVVPDKTYVNYSQGSPNTVTFFTGINAKAICTEEHMKIAFVVGIQNNPTIPMKIFGDAYWSAFSDEVILFNGVPNSQT